MRPSFRADTVRHTSHGNRSALRKSAGHRCRSKRKAVGIPPRFRFERFQFKVFRLKRFRFEHGDLSVAARTLRPDVAVVAALADPGRAVLVPPRRPLLADATLPLLALTHLGDSLPRTSSPAWLLAPSGAASGATELADAPGTGTTITPRTQGVMARARRSNTASRDRPALSIRLAAGHNSAGSPAHSCSTTVT